MKFIEQLEAAQKAGINILNLRIATALNHILKFDYTEDEFEKLCQFTKNTIEKSIMTNRRIDEAAVADTFNDLIADEEYTVAGLLESDPCEILERAIYYM